MGLFDDVDNAKPSADGGNYITAGHYFLRVDRVKAEEESQSDAGAFVAVEMTVVDTHEDGDVPKDKDFNSLGKDAWHRPGEKVTHLMLKKHKSFAGNFKAFVMNVGDIEESKVTSDACKQVCEGLFEGLLIEVRARTIKTRAGNAFTKVAYVREVPPTEVQERVDADQLKQIGIDIEELVEAYGE